MGPALITDPSALRRACDEARGAGGVVGLVPTMGALHRGHLALVGEARRRARLVVVSIFVNPTQFGPNEDFASYPRDLEGDRHKLADAGADVVFAPDAAALYPPGDQTRVRVGPLAERLCGPSRPGHFEGVATVVTKLFSLVGPSVAVFGRKDYQQLRVIDRVVRDLLLPVDVVGLPTVRELDGLAMSSRNAYLAPPARARALSLSTGLRDAAALFATGERNAGVLTSVARAPLDAADLVEYVAIADPATLDPIAPADEVGPRALLAVAARVGGTRLIDNLVLGEDAAPPGG